jgi:hypothetical protein
VPETLGFLLLSAAGVTEIGGFAILPGTAAIVGNVALATAAIGANVLANVLANKPQGTKPQDGQITTRQSLPNRRRNYGTVKVGGPLIFSETLSGSRYQVIALNQGEINAFMEHWFSDQKSALDVGGHVTDLYTKGAAQFVTVSLSTGPAADAAFSRLTTAFPTLWTSAHKGNGIAKALIITEQPASDDFTTVYPGGQPPVYRTVIESTMAWDPRITSDRTILTFTTNPVLIALDYHRHADGMGLAVYDSTFFTDTSITEDWIPAANICDEPIANKDSTTSPRYRCCGGYDLASPPKDVLASILSTCDGQTYQRGDGAIGIRVGKDVSPTITISDQNILGYEGFRSGPVNALTGVNRVTAKYTDANLDFQEAAADPWDDTVALDLAGRAEVRDLPLQWVPAHPQARRLMKLAMHRLNPQWSGRVICNLDGLRAWGERYITLQIAELGIDSTFELTAPPEFIPASMQVVLTVASLDAAAFSWDALTEEGTAPALPPEGTTVDVIDPPTSLALVSTTSRIITVSWASPTRGDEVADAQYSVHAVNNWFNASVNGSHNGATTPVLAAGTYDVQVRFRVGTNTSNWVPLIGVVVS